MTGEEEECGFTTRKKERREGGGGFATPKREGEGGWVYCSPKREEMRVGLLSEKGRKRRTRVTIKKKGEGVVHDQKGKGEGGYHQKGEERRGLLPIRRSEGAHHQKGERRRVVTAKK